MGGFVLLSYKGAQPFFGLNDMTMHYRPFPTGLEPWMINRPFAAQLVMMP
jgi:hypothetical protein